MFETDDYDEVLSQFECPELESITSSVARSYSNDQSISISGDVEKSHTESSLPITSGTKNRRTFPGPAGILVGCMSDYTNNKQSHVELSSQDVGNLQNQLPNDVFDTRMWNTFERNVGTLFERNGSSYKVETVKSIKSQASDGTLLRQKAPMVIGIVQSIDRSIADPLVTLRDPTGEISCTLAREAWCAFSVFLHPEQTALAVWQPTVLTFGTSHKRHYLNITLGNLHALYCTALNVKTKDHQMPDGYERKDADEFTIIEKVVTLRRHIVDSPVTDSNDADTSVHRASTEDVNFLDGLDAESFCEDF